MVGDNEKVQTALSGLGDFTLGRETPFSYRCNRCSRCCYGKRIPLTPYDLIRLADELQITTGELIEKHTDEGVFLKVKQTFGEPCVFLGPEGCTVHQGRPGACRIYPLGRNCTVDGEEGFLLVEPHPETEGEYGEKGTIGDYVLTQGLEPYFNASNRYLKLFLQLRECEDVLNADPSETERAPEIDLLDVDAVVSSYCRETGEPVPSDPDSKMDFHIRAIEKRLTLVSPDTKNQ